MANKRWDVFPPGCCANPRNDKWLCEVRDGGFIADWKLFDTEQEAQSWGENHNGQTSNKATRAIADMAIRWTNK